MASGSHPSPCHWVNLCSMVPTSLWIALVSLTPAGIFNIVMIVFHFVLYTSFYSVVLNKNHAVCKESPV